MGLVRWQLLSAFLTGVPKPSGDTVRAVSDYRLNRDRNMRPAEQERIKRFMLEHG